MVGSDFTQRKIQSFHSVLEDVACAGPVITLTFPTTPAVHSALAISAFYCFLKMLDLPLSRAFPLAVPSAWNALLLDSLTI